MPAGRPLKFKTVEELQEKIDAYFQACDSRMSTVVLKNGSLAAAPNPRPYTITGLALALETTRDLLIDYAEKDEFSDAIKNAKLKCQNFAEESLWTEKIAAGVIFNLKNNYGWRDKTEQEVYGKNGEALFPVTEQDAEDYAKWKLQQGVPTVAKSESPSEASTDMGVG